MENDFLGFGFGIIRLKNIIQSATYHKTKSSQKIPNLKTF